jgi:hypothetical protein
MNDPPQAFRFWALEITTVVDTQLERLAWLFEEAIYLSRVSLCNGLPHLLCHG